MPTRTRPRLFSFSREIELGHYDEIVRSGEARAALEAVVDAFIEVCGDRRLTPARLRPIADAAGHADLHVRIAAMHRLAVLCHDFEEAVEALAAFPDHPDPDVRLLACASLANVPARVAAPLLARYLQDPVWLIRKSAGQVASAVPMPGLLTTLTSALQQERDARVRVVLQLARGFQEEQN